MWEGIGYDLFFFVLFVRLGLIMEFGSNIPKRGKSTALRSSNLSSVIRIRRATPTHKVVFRKHLSSIQQSSHGFYVYRKKGRNKSPTSGRPLIPHRNEKAQVSVTMGNVYLIWQGIYL